MALPHLKQHKFYSPEFGYPSMQIPKFYLNSSLTNIAKSRLSIRNSLTLPCLTLLHFVLGFAVWTFWYKTATQPERLSSTNSVNLSPSVSFIFNKINFEIFIRDLPKWLYVYIWSIVDPFTEKVVYSLEKLLSDINAIPCWLFCGSFSYRFN